MTPPTESPVPPPKDSPSPQLGVARGQLAAWVAVAIVNAIMIVRTVPSPSAGIRLRLGHLAAASGQVLALGFISAAVVTLSALARKPTAAPAGSGFRVRARALAAPLSALAALSIALGFALLDDDLGNLAGRLIGADAGSYLPMLIALITAVSLCIPAAAVVGRLLDRDWLRWVGFSITIGAAIANHIVLQNDYPGAHVYLVWSAAVCGGASIAGLRLPSRLASPSRAGTFALAALGLASITSVLWWPGTAVMVELYKTSGALVTPFRARFHEDAAGGTHPPIPAESMPWFVDRGSAPDVPPTAPSVSPTNRIIIFLVIDSFRADMLSSGKYGSKLPALTQLARESVDFTRARSPGSQTIYSFPAIFAGKYFSQMLWTQKVPNGFWPHRDTSVHFTQRLTQAGIPTAAFLRTPWLLADDEETAAVKGITEQSVVLRPATFSRAMIKRFSNHGSGGLFVLLHYMEAHWPYRHAGVEGEPFERYVAGLAAVDDEITRIRTGIETYGLTDRATLIVTGDHGEAFGEHGATQHGVNLYEELIHVPLLIHEPRASARRVDEPVTLMDIGPTVLDLMGLPTPGSSMGQSLVPFLRGENPKLTRPIVAEGRLKQVLVLPDQTKVIRDLRKGTVEVYDLTHDPGESRNLYAEDETRFTPQVNVLREFFRVQTLRKLGYKPPYRP